MRGLRASRWSSGDFCPGCRPASNRTATPYGNANLYNGTNHHAHSHANHHTHRRADSHPKPDSNR